MQVNHQLGTNRNARHQLERDLANKDNAINIGNVLTPIRKARFPFRYLSLYQSFSPSLSFILICQGLLNNCLPKA